MSELESKVAELESLKKSYEEFIESSAALEKELEDALKESELKCTDLNKKKTAAEEKYNSLYERYTASGHQLTSSQKELSIALEKLVVADQKRIALEQRIDELEESVRILQATEDDLQYKLSKSEEDIIFLQNDIYELKSERENSERRLKAELTDIQAELSKYDMTKDSESQSDKDNNEISHKTLSNEEVINVAAAVTNNPDEKDMNIEIIEELELEIEELTERLRETELQNQQLNDEVSRLADELMTIAEKSSKQQQSSVVTTNNEIAVEESTNTFNTNSTDELSIKIDQQKIYIEEIENLKLIISSKEQKVTELTSQYSDLSNDLKNKISSLDILKTNYNELQNQYKITNDHIIKLNQELDSLKSDKKFLDESQLFEKEKSISLEMELEKRSIEYQTLQNQCILQADEIETLKIELFNSQNKNKDIDNDGDNNYKHKHNDDESNGDALNVHILSKQWQDEKHLLLREIELLRDAITQSTIQNNNHITDNENNTVTTPRNLSHNGIHLSPIRTTLHGTSSPRHLTAITETPVSKTAILLDSTEIGQKEIDDVVLSGNIDKIKILLTSKVTELEAMRASNARLLQKLQAARGNIQVCCRPRPPSITELGEHSINKKGGQICVEVVDDNELVCFDRRTESWKPFVFDRVWKLNASQADVFADVEPLVLSVVEGYNTCLLAYGQTGSGKTFTMNGYGNEYGVSYRTLKKIFEVLHTKQSEVNANKLTMMLHQQATHMKSNLGSSTVTVTPHVGHTIDDSTVVTTTDVPVADGSSPPKDTATVTVALNSPNSPTVEIESENFSFNIEVSMMEIYNDNVYDLLNESGTESEVLDIRQAADGTVHVPGLQQVCVSSLEDVLNVFEKGSANRATAATGLNENSSRSHSILVVDVSSVYKGSTTRAKLYLVDLAGSERAGKSGVTGAAMKETQHINKSLSALGDVMEALDTKAKHIPYRNSKLTYLLQDSLGGNSRTMMIVTVCPTDITVDETLFTLGFASRVRNVSLGVARRNVNAKNLEESLKITKKELQESKKKRSILEDGINELKKQLKKTNDKLISLNDTKGKQVDDIKKNTDFQIIQLQKNNSELILKLQEEKENKHKLHNDYETLQKSFKKINDQLKDVQKERETMIANMKSRDNEREKEQKEREFKENQNNNNIGISSLTRPPVRGTASSHNSSHLGPPVRSNTSSIATSTSSFPVPATRPAVRRVLPSRTSIMPTTRHSIEGEHDIDSTHENYSVDNNTATQRTPSRRSIIGTTCNSAKDFHSTNNTARIYGDTNSDCGDSVVSTSSNTANSTMKLRKLSSTSTASSSRVSRMSMLPGRVLSSNSNGNNSTEASSSSSSSGTNASATVTTSSTLQRNSSIAIRSKEALLRHQERMEKFRERQAMEQSNSKANIIKQIIVTSNPNAYLNQNNNSTIL